VFGKIGLRRYQVRLREPDSTFLHFVPSLLSVCLNSIWNISRIGLRTASEEDTCKYGL